MGLIQRAAAKVKQVLAQVDSRGWWPWIREPFTGAWQKNEEWKIDDVTAYHAVYACVTLISSDVAKLPISVMRQDDNGIWLPTTTKDRSPRVLSVRKLLKKFNSYQNHIQFKQWWATSKLLRGNTYVLKYRNSTGEVERLYILNPDLVTVLVSPDGSVFYQLNNDNLAGLDEPTITVPASEIIHDRMNCLFHPLVGVSPLYACGLAAHQGLKIQNDSTRFYANGARPGGILTAPGAISDETAARLKAHWDANYTGQNTGKVAVLGDDLKYQSLRMTSADAQTIEQLKWTAEVVCSAFHVPAYKVGVGPIPPNNNIEALTTEYYSQCLQIHIEEMELCLDEGLALPEGYGIELNLDGLFRMDSANMVKTLVEGVKGGLFKPNEARKRMNLSPIEGGDTIYLQQQYFSLEALNSRDENDPLDPVVQNPAETASDDEENMAAQARMLATMIEKEARIALSS